MCTPDYYDKYIRHQFLKSLYSKSLGYDNWPTTIHGYDKINLVSIYTVCHVHMINMVSQNMWCGERIHCHTVLGGVGQFLVVRYIGLLCICSFSFVLCLQEFIAHPSIYRNRFWWHGFKEKESLHHGSEMRHL